MGENLVPDFNIYDYGIGFSRMDFGDRYLRWPLYRLYKYDYERALKKHNVDRQEWEKRDFCAMVVTNPDGRGTSFMTN